MDKYLSKWHDSLGTLTETVKKSYELSQTLLMSATLQSQYYKTFFQLYYTPNRISKWGVGKSTRCPRCNMHKANIVHIFATCVTLEGLIKDISAFVSEIFQASIEISAGEILLGYDDNNRSKKMQGFIFISMSVLRLFYSLCMARSISTRVSTMAPQIVSHI